MITAPNKKWFRMFSSSSPIKKKQETLMLDTFQILCTIC